MRPGDDMIATKLFFRDTQVAAIATALVPNKANLAFYITGWRASFNGTPASAVQLQLKNGVTVIDQYEIAAVYIPPIIINFHRRPWEMTRGLDTTLVMPSLGGAVRVTVMICGFYSTPSV